jgi:murein DD-endopeptidase MepM/ murein hydrolase activator NlpD
MAVQNTQMKLAVIYLFIIYLLSSCAVSTNPLRTQFRQLQSGKITEDTSYLYQLPYNTNETHRIVQGYFTRYSHKERAALDFKMKQGTPILAARGGVVVRVKEDGDKGGLNKKYRPYGNVIIIEHEDKSRAGYWHLQHNGVLVTVGDTVMQGQHIGYSGKTGYSAFPHLHFLVWTFSNNNWQQIANRFKTSKGNIYLRPLKKYKSQTKPVAR